MRTSAVLLVLAVIAALAAHVSGERHVVLSAATRVPSGWQRASASGPSAPVHFFLALPQRNLERLESLFWAVSDPDSAQYQEYMSAEQIQSLVSPPWSERQEVIDWLLSEGVQRDAVLCYGDSLEVTTTVDVASRLFEATFHDFTNAETGRKLVKAVSDVSLPLPMRSRVELVLGLTAFPVPHLSIHPRKLDTAAPRPIENDGIIPSTIFNLYGVPANQTVGSNDIGQGVIEWERQSFNAQDLAYYAGNVSVPLDPVPDSQIVGKNDPKQPGGESTLDIEMVAGVAPANSNVAAADSSSRSHRTAAAAATHRLLALSCPVPVCSVGTQQHSDRRRSCRISGCFSPSSPFLPLSCPRCCCAAGFWLESDDAWQYTFTVHFINSTAAPDVSSISYSWFEGDQCEEGIGGGECKGLNVSSMGYVHRVNTEYMKIGLLGRSIVVSSGDSGAHTRFDEGCTAAHLLAEFPPSSPFVTSVGATEVQNETLYDTTFAPACARKQNYTCVQDGLEVAVDLTRAYFTSGGGFSNYSMQPFYQRETVREYLRQKTVPLPPADMYHRMGRAWPDVAANGHNAFIMMDGFPMLTGGTSQSSPIFAAVLALLNAEYKNITGKPIGFANPLLYRMANHSAAAFTDITSGDNICPEAGCSKTCKGWYAAKGWDPVTGLGTPNYPAMLSYIQELGRKVVKAREARAEAARTAAHSQQPHAPIGLAQA